MAATTTLRASLGDRLIRPSRVLSQTRPLWIGILGVLALLQLVVYLGHIRSAFAWNDFRLYYAGAQVGLHDGWSHIYDPDLEHAAVAALHPTGPWFALLTPAPITWLVAPLTVIPYPAAYWVWVALCLAVLGAAVWYSRPRHLPVALTFLWWATLGPLWFSVFEGQVTLLVAAAVLVGWRLLETRREYLGGAVLAVALFKPHLVLLLPVALAAAGRWRPLLAFAAVSAAAGVGTLATLHVDGLRAYLEMLNAPQPQGDMSATLRYAIGGGAAALAVQAVVLATVLVVSFRAGRARATWPLVVAALLGSFLLASYWHPQDYLGLCAAAAIMLAAGPGEAAILVAAAMALVAMPLSPLTNRMGSPQMILAWLIFAGAFLAYLGVRALRTFAPQPALTG